MKVFQIQWRRKVWEWASLQKPFPWTPIEHDQWKREFDARRRLKYWRKSTRSKAIQFRIEEVELK